MTRLAETKAYYQRGTELLEEMRKVSDEMDPREVFTRFEVRLDGAKELIAYVEALEADRAALLTGFRWLGGFAPFADMHITEDQKKQVTRAYAIEKDEERPA